MNFRRNLALDLSLDAVKLGVQILLVLGQVVLDTVNFGIELLLVGLNLLDLSLNLDKALLDGLRDSIPLGVSVGIDCGLHNDDVNFGLNVFVFVNKLLQALLIELNNARDDGLDLAVHDVLIRLAKDRN